MSVLYAALLGIVQGLTEFIPVSSSAHLVLVPYLLGLPPPSLSFNLALHMGTVGAVLVHFRRELAAMIGGLVGRSTTADQALYRRLAVLTLVATVPVGVVGLLFRDFFEGDARSPLSAAGYLLVSAVLLVLTEVIRDRRVGRANANKTDAAGAEEGRRVWTGDWRGGDGPPGGVTGDVAVAARPTLPVGEDADDPAGRTLERLGLREALVVGVLQVPSLLSGVSRSGTTILGGIAAGLTREAATRFSFLLSLPALIGAGLVEVPDVLDGTEAIDPMVVAVGVVASFASGLLAIRVLLTLVARDRLTGFAKYCVGAAVVGLLGYLMIGPPSSV